MGWPQNITFEWENETYEAECTLVEGPDRYGEDADGNRGMDLTGIIRVEEINFIVLPDGEKVDWETMKVMQPAEVIISIWNIIQEEANKGEML
ncbi:MAG: hypothetical protein U9Q21_00850 [Candidatus Auribacterota bacterium]|nr:hypothetical protein [Candidatus Auribacterota bacterium]